MVNDDISGGRADTLQSMQGELTDINYETCELQIVTPGDTRSISFDYSHANKDLFDIDELTIGEFVEIRYFESFSARGCYLIDAVAVIG